MARLRGCALEYVPRRHGISETSLRPTGTGLTGRQVSSCSQPLLQVTVLPRVIVLPQVMATAGDGYCKR